jgi:hypothetical protein
MTDTDELAEAVARQDHVFYNRAAEHVGWETQEVTRVDFDDLPEVNRRVMVLKARWMLDALVISAGPAVVGGIREEET